MINPDFGMCFEFINKLLMKCCASSCISLSLFLTFLYIVLLYDLPVLCMFFYFANYLEDNLYYFIEENIYT